MSKATFYSLLSVFFFTGLLQGQNYNEKKVPIYNMIDPLKKNGSKISAVNWPRRHSEILALFEKNMFGKTPEFQPVRFEVLEKQNSAFNGRAFRYQVRAHFSDKKDGPSMDILIYLPAKATQAVPLFLGLNFLGNHTVDPDKNIIIPQGLCKPDSRIGRRGNKASAKERGSFKRRWPIESIINRGYGLATINYYDIEPDTKDGHTLGVRSLFPQLKNTDWQGQGLF